MTFIMRIYASLYVSTTLRSDRCQIKRYRFFFFFEKRKIDNSLLEKEKLCLSGTYEIVVEIAQTIIRHMQFVASNLSYAISNGELAWSTHRCRL